MKRYFPALLGLALFFSLQRSLTLVGLLFLSVWALGVAWARQEADRVVRDRRKVVRKMRTALHSGQIGMHYQPVIDMSTGTCVGAEALCRWEHPDGVRLPGPWLDTLLGAELGDEFNNRMRFEVFTLAESLPHLRFNWNVAPGRLDNPLWADGVLSDIWQTGVNPNQLCAEITETSILRSTETVRENLRRVRDHGVRVALDDFGTGASEVRSLINFPIDVVKIDRSLIQAKDRRYAEAIAGMCLATGHAVVAEGVETSEQVEWLSETCGVAVGQGWLWSKALPPVEFALRAGNLLVRW